MKEYLEEKLNKNREDFDCSEELTVREMRVIIDFLVAPLNTFESIIQDLKKSQAEAPDNEKSLYDKMIYSELFQQERLRQIIAKCNSRINYKVGERVKKIDNKYGKNITESIRKQREEPNK